MQNVIPAFEKITRLSWPDQLAFLTYRFLQMPQVQFEIKHLFEPGIYIREMTLPADSLFIGRIHRVGHEVQLLSGAVIHCHYGSQILLDKPVSVNTPPGYQMVAYSLTEIRARSLHPNPHESRDIEELEEQYFGPVQHLIDRGRQLEQEFDDLRVLEW